MWNRPSFKLVAALLIAVIVILPPPLARARHMMPDLINVPVERLIRNLETLAAKEPRDAEVRLNLARVHSMAFALKTETAQVWKGQENKGAWFGYEHDNIPFQVKPSDDKATMRAAREHLAKASKWYREALALDDGNLAAALGYAWCVEQSGDKRKAIEEYRKVVKAAWAKERNLTNGDLGWRSVTAEAAGYLIPLLDKNTNSQEIARLENRVKRMEMVPRPITPLVVPLRDGLTPGRLEDRFASVNFDADGTGLKKSWTWITPDAGWLVYDQAGTSKITSALQMFGSVTFWLFWENGYRALAMLDDDQNGRLSGGELKNLAIWQDLNRNGVADRGEVRALASWGIVALSCRYIRDETDAGRIAYSPRGVFFGDGSSRPTYDLILRPAISD